ncbi:unnamed protein product, partial [marine sediment metagenome]
VLIRKIGADLNNRIAQSRKRSSFANSGGLL